MPENGAYSTGQPAANALTDDLKDLAQKWDEAGINPDLFVTCATCGGIFEGAELPGDRVCKCDEEDG